MHTAHMIGVTHQECDKVVQLYARPVPEPSYHTQWTGFRMTADAFSRSLYVILEASTSSSASTTESVPDLQEFLSISSTSTRLESPAQDHGVLLTLSTVVGFRFGEIRNISINGDVVDHAMMLNCVRKVSVHSLLSNHTCVRHMCI